MVFNVHATLKKKKKKMLKKNTQTKNPTWIVPHWIWPTGQSLVCSALGIEGNVKLFLISLFVISI